MSHIKDCLIVAAGQGTRIKGLGDSKPLIELDGTPLIEHAMRSAHEAGVQNFVVITGYQADRLCLFLDQLATRTNWSIATQFNPEFLSENGLSVLAGEPHLDGEFYLAMCDHVVEPSLYRQLAQAELPTGAVGLGVDHRLDNPMVDIDDVTKVQLSQEFISHIGKTLTQYSAFDTGIFRASPSLFAAIQTSRDRTGDCSISGGMELLASQKLAIGINTKNADWIDVDSVEMHKIATKWLQKKAVNRTNA